MFLAGPVCQAYSLHPDLVRRFQLCPGCSEVLKKHTDHLPLIPNWSNSPVTPPESIPGGSRHLSHFMRRISLPIFAPPPSITMILTFPMPPARSSGALPRPTPQYGVTVGVFYCISIHIVEMYTSLMMYGLLS